MVPMLEIMRRRLRGLDHLIDKHQREPIYTAFEDLMGDEVGVNLPGFAPGTDYKRFLAKVRAFLRQHLEHDATQKLSKNQPLTTDDLAELERILMESGLGGPDDVRRAAEESQGLGLLVRSLVGMDRTAAKAAMSTFLSGDLWSANQIELANLVVDHSSEQGVIAPDRLYESPVHGRNAARTGWLVHAWSTW